MLLHFQEFLQSDPAIDQDVHQTVDFMLGLMQNNGNFAPAMDEVGTPRPEGEQLVHWCHGAPGKCCSLLHLQYLSEILLGCFKISF
jgi:hypothetical protein